MSNTKVIVLTGASRGLGLEVARKLLDQPVLLYGTSRSGDHIPLKPLNAEARLDVLKFDQSKPEDISALVERVKEEQGSVDLLIVNAGFNTLESTPEAVKKIFDINFHGATQVSEPKLRKALVTMSIDCSNVYSHSQGRSSCGRCLFWRFTDSQT